MMQVWGHFLSPVFTDRCVCPGRLWPLNLVLVLVLVLDWSMLPQSCFAVFSCSQRDFICSCRLTSVWTSQGFYTLSSFTATDVLSSWTRTEVDQQNPTLKQLLVYLLIILICRASDLLKSFFCPEFSYFLFSFQTVTDVKLLLNKTSSYRPSVCCRLLA